MESKKINNHTHNKIYYGDGFLGKATPFITKHTIGIAKFMKILLPSHHDLLDRWANYLLMFKKSDEEIIRETMAEYPDFIINILQVDLSQMGAGKIKKYNYIDHCKNLLELKKKLPIRVCIMIDPRVPYLNELYDFVLENIEEIDGLKMYPNVGYTITDKRLKPFFQLADHYHKPCFIHTTITTPVYYKGKDLDTLLDKIRGDEGFHDFGNAKENCGNFCNPIYVQKLCDIYKNVKFVISHHAGFHKPYVDLTNKLCRTKKNVFADISYTYVEFDPQAVLKCINDSGCKSLFGCDTYMIKPKKQNPFPFYYVLFENYFKEAQKKFENKK